jgi:hypothetical protein
LNHSERKNERQQNPEAYLEHLKKNERKVQQMQKNRLWFETILEEPTMSKRIQSTIELHIIFKNIQQLS